LPFALLVVDVVVVVVDVVIVDVVDVLVCKCSNFL
jgi:hypothetical protein